MENNASVRRAIASARREGHEDLHDALGEDQLLKVTALWYFKDALVTQKFETCRELIDMAKQAGAVQGDIAAVITDYLAGDSPGRQKANRLRP